MKILDLLPPWEISITEILLYLFLQNTTAWTGMLGKKKKKTEGHQATASSKWSFECIDLGMYHTKNLFKSIRKASSTSSESHAVEGEALHDLVLKSQNSLRYVEPHYKCGMAS